MAMNLLFLSRYSASSSRPTAKTTDDASCFSRSSFDFIHRGRWRISILAYSGLFLASSACSSSEVGGWGKLSPNFVLTPFSCTLYHFLSVRAVAWDRPARMSVKVCAKGRRSVAFWSARRNTMQFPCQLYLTVTTLSALAAFGPVCSLSLISRVASGSVGRVASDVPPWISTISLEGWWADIGLSDVVCAGVGLGLVDVLVAFSGGGRGLYVGPVAKLTCGFSVWLLGVCVFCRIEDLEVFRVMWDGLSSAWCFCWASNLPSRLIILLVRSISDLEMVARWSWLLFSCGLGGCVCWIPRRIVIWLAFCVIMSGNIASMGMASISAMTSRSLMSKSLKT